MIKLLKNSFGFSFMEVVVATGLMGAVSLGVLKLSDGSQKQTIVANQNFDFDNMAKEFSMALSDSAQCSTMIQDDNGNLSVDASGLTSELRYGAQLISTEVISPVKNSQVETLPVTIFLRFNRGEDPGDGKAVRKVVIPALFDQNGAFVECINYQTEAQKTAFKLSCEFIGGTFVDGRSGTESCDLTNIDSTVDLIKDSMKKVCTEALNGNFNEGTGHCESINLGITSPIIGSNINLNQIGLSNNFRTTFAQETCNLPNQFIKSINVDGSVNCTELKFRVPGSPPPPPPPPPPLTAGACEHNDIIVDIANLPGNWNTKCAQGNMQNFTDANQQFTWNCVGTSSTASCTVHKEAECGASQGGDFENAPASNFCNWPISTRSGNVTLAGNTWSWTCAGLGAGNTKGCTANKVDGPPPPPENLVWVYDGQQPSYCSQHAPGSQHFRDLGYDTTSSLPDNKVPPRPCKSKFDQYIYLWTGTNNNAGCISTNPMTPNNIIPYRWKCEEQ